MRMNTSPIISPEQLAAIIDQVKIFDVSSGKEAKANYLKEHIKGAYFIDLNSQLSAIKENAADGGRHPLPSPEKFARTLSNYGLSPESHIIVYDDKNGANAAARFWWMLRAVGHEKVQVLDGGLASAKLSGIPVSSGEEIPDERFMTYQADQWLLPIVNLEQVESVSLDEEHKVIDVREADRYNGLVEPIDLIAGHIPGAINIPYMQNLDQNGRFLEPEQLKEMYERELDGVESKNTIVHCGSGVTACHTLLAMAYAGLEIPKLYVGSWSEWSRNDMPMVTKDL
ncbi:MAG: sulfurtransferase [Saprospiraceae bacterium]|nr:sulfurtransferase [Saprospiraceae bacterium]